MKNKLVIALLTGAMVCSMALTGCSKETPASGEGSVQTEESSEEETSEPEQEKEETPEVNADDLLDLPLIVSRQGLREDIPKLFGEAVDRLNITATLNLTYNGSVLAREGLGYVLTFDKLVDTSEQSELCFRPLTPALETKLYVVWKKYQVFSPAAELLLNETKGH